MLEIFCITLAGHLLQRLSRDLSRTQIGPFGVPPCSSISLFFLPSPLEAFPLPTPILSVVIFPQPGPISLLPQPSRSRVQQSQEQSAAPSRPTSRTATQSSFSLGPFPITTALKHLPTLHSPQGLSHSSQFLRGAKPSSSI